MMIFLIVLAAILKEVLPACPEGVKAQCDCVKLVNKVDWNKINGTWFIIESSFKLPFNPVCIGMNLSPKHRTYTLKLKGKTPVHANILFEERSPQIWFTKTKNGGYFTYVTIISEPLSALVLISCGTIFGPSNSQWVAVYNREPMPSATTMEAIHKEMTAANVTKYEQLYSFVNNDCH